MAKYISIEKVVNKYISLTQFGFMNGKSCSQALHIIRRLPDYGEMSQTNVIAVFLDWKQAFDKVEHSKLIEALRRIGICDHFLEVIGNLYEQPMFYAKYEQQKSELRHQSAGIRQGCTLSPYLFIILMTILMHDARQNTRQWTINTKIPGLKNPDILFADDTTLVTSNTKAMHKLLHEIEHQSEYYGLSLNNKKMFRLCNQ